MTSRERRLDELRPAAFAIAYRMLGCLAFSPMRIRRYCSLDRLTRAEQHVVREPGSPVLLDSLPAARGLDAPRRPRAGAHVDPDGLDASCATTRRRTSCSLRHRRRAGGRLRRRPPQDGEVVLRTVDPAHAGQGVGRFLSTAPTTRCAPLAAPRRVLLHLRRNARALAVYAAAGYEPDDTARESDFRGTPTREVRLVKSL